MKRLLLTIGIGLGLLPSLAMAQEASVCDRIREMPAVSPYVRLVVERAREGLARGGGGGAAELLLPTWFAGSFSAVARLVDARTGLTERVRDLPEATMCLHFDVLLLQCTIFDAQRTLKDQIAAKSPIGILRAQSVLEFLHARLGALLTGATEETFLDREALQQHLFDRRGFGKPGGPEDAVCGDGFRTPPEECDDSNRRDGDGCDRDCRSEMCPFSSDYLDHVPSAGIGCAPSVMEEGSRRTATDALGAETDAAKQLLAARKTFLEQVRGMNASGAVLEDPPHVTIAGCQRGFCEAEPDRPCGSSNDCAKDDRCVFARRGGTGTVLALATPRSAFSFARDERRLLTRFVDLWRRQGERRSWTELLKNPSDVPAGEREKAIRRDRTNAAGMQARQVARARLKTFESAQATKDTLLFATVIDADRQFEAALAPLHTSVSRLAKLAREQNGIRFLVRNMAFYVRRVCTERPCNQRLEQILKLGFTDACFPYTNGEFLGDTDDATRWETCMREAEIE